MIATRTLPEQKLPQSKKTKDWYIENIEAACYLTRSNSFYLNTWRNQLENYNLSIGILDTKSLAKRIDISNQGLDAYPVELRHIGIGNSKLNILIGDYLERKFDFKASISSKDEDGVSSKEEGLKSEMFKRLNDVLTKSFEAKEIDEAYYQKELNKLLEWQKYDYQDKREIVINQLLNFYYASDDFPLKFALGFKDFIHQGKVAYWIDVFGGRPEIRKMNPLSVTGVGGTTNFIHEKDIIIVEEYKSVGQIYDDYWDQLTETQRKELETLKNNVAPLRNITSIVGSDGLFDSQSIFDVIAQNNYDLEHFSPVHRYSELTGALGDRILRNSQNELLVTTVFWKTRRKVGQLTYFENGMPVVDFVSENYQPDVTKGETVSWKWINEWCRGTKVGHNMYLDYGPIKASSRSMTNLSSGLPPIIGLEVERSLYDAIKELDLAYDVTYWKRAMMIATYQGTKTAINASMIPNGDVKEFLHMANIDNIMLLDPTNEIQKGPAIGKTAGGVLNTFITQDVKMGTNDAGITMLTNQLMDLEYTMGMICGIPKERMGDVGERQAVRNTQFEIAQFQKATELWFQLENNLRRVALKKFIDVIKLFHKENPVAGSYFLSDLGQEFLNTMGIEFTECEYDLHANNTSKDTKLQAILEQNVEQAIAQGGGSIQDLIAVSTGGSIQKIAARLKQNEVARQEAEAAAAKRETDAEEKLKLLDAQENQKQRDHELQLKEMDVDVKVYEIDQRTAVALATANNNEPELIDDNSTDLVDLSIREKTVNETIRHNKVTERITEKNNTERNKIAKIQKKKPTSTK